MCGITDYVFRTICFELGCDQAYTEMISAMGYLCSPSNRTTLDLMKRGEKEPSLILQLFGKDPGVISEAIARIDETIGSYDGYDINMGCPAHKVASSGEGCGLMLNPKNAFAIMSSAVRATKKPVSVKMRLGWDDQHKNVFQFARLAEEAGISEITVHGRTRTQQYSGRADWNMIREVKESISLPVTGNGDLFDADDAVEKWKRSGTDAIMVARGALGNPWIFRDIKRRLAGGNALPAPTWSERHQMILRHYQDMLLWKPEPIAIREMRKHIGWYVHGIRCAAKIRATVNLMTTRSEVFRYLEEVFEELELNDEQNQ